MGEAVLRNFGRILRYFAAPVVGLGTVHFFDASNSVLASLVTIADTGNPPEPVISWWPLTMFTLVFGVILYHAHRTLFHSWFNYCDVWVIARLRNKQVTARQLDRARAHRENGPANGPERAYQARLNDLNAAGHFFWCSAWSIWLVPMILSPRFPTIAVGEMWRNYIVVFIFLFLTALISDVRTTDLDFYAYEQYPAYHGDPTPVNQGAGPQQAAQQNAQK